MVIVKPNLNQKGMLTEDRRKKEIYYYCQARWSDIPMIHIAGADWTKRVEICDDSINVRKISVFSNQKTVELIHNGKSLGVREVVNGEAVFAVPFINGENLLDARSGALSDRLKIQMNRRQESRILMNLFPRQNPIRKQWKNRDRLPHFQVFSRRLH